jgi:hypothetical protein
MQKKMMFALLMVGCTAICASENSKDSEKIKRKLNGHTYEGYEESNIPRIAFIGKRIIDENGAYSIAAARKFRKAFDENCTICDFNAQGQLLAVHRTDSFHSGSLSSSNGFHTSKYNNTSGCERECCTYYSHVYANRNGTFNEQIIFDYILKRTSLSRIDSSYQVGPYTNVNARFYDYSIHCSSLFGFYNCKCEAREPGFGDLPEEIKIKDQETMFKILDAHRMRAQGKQQMKDGKLDGKQMVEDADKNLEALKAEYEQKKLQKRDELHNSLLK